MWNLRCDEIFAKVTKAIVEIVSLTRQIIKDTIQFTRLIQCQSELLAILCLSCSAYKHQTNSCDDSYLTSSFFIVTQLTCLFFRLSSLSLPFSFFLSWISFHRQLVCVIFFFLFFSSQPHADSNKNEFHATQTILH